MASTEHPQNLSNPTKEKTGLHLPLKRKNQGMFSIKFQEIGQMPYEISKVFEKILCLFDSSKCPVI